ncbi:MAG: fasciclin domain-containing protein [Flavobacteriales bacterium]|nr:fasciclin domain-containing protein [Flavobacteriales bacterium]
MPIRPLVMLSMVFFSFQSQSQCEADHTIVMADYYFAPAELTILPGETVAFVNVQGTHDVDGITNTLTGEPWNNPAEFYLEETEGTEEGTCMGVVTFDIPGVYNFDSSIGFQAQLGMVGSITVDAFTLLDLMLSWNGNDTAPEAWQSTYCMQFVCTSCAAALGGIGEYTVFLPSDNAVDALGDLMNLNQFDMLAIPDFQDILEYHIVEGVYLAEDLEPGMVLPTLNGEGALVGENAGGLTIDGVNIVETNYTADNGVIHIIDYGMAPSTSPEATVYQIVVDSPDHSLFEQEINANLLNDDLIGQPVINNNEYAPGHFTVFAPTDDAIFAFAEENGFDDVDDLFDSPYWDEILRRHIVETPLTSDQLSNNGLLVSYGGENIFTFVNDDGIFVENAQVTAPDLLAYNGVVHVINEVIDFEFPNPVGTCGTWTLNMYAPEGDGWSGVMQVLVDNVLVGEPTLQDGFSDSYAFAVNEGSSVDMNYISQFAGWPGNFEVVDAEGTILFDSDSPANSNSQYGTAAGVYGLKACSAAPECSQIKVTLYSDYDGWDLANLLVYDGPALVDVIGGFWFNGEALIGYVDIQNGDDVDFEVNGGYYSTSYSYKVEDGEGNILVDQVEQNVPAEDVFGVVICAATGIAEAPELMEVRFVPNPATESVRLTGIADDIRWELSVQTLTGQEALITNGVGPKQIDLGALSAGTYLGRVRSENGATRGIRLVVQ